MDSAMHYSYVGLIPFFPLLGFLINSFYGYRLRIVQTGLIASIFSSISFLLSLYLLFDFLSLGKLVGNIIYFDWISIGKLSASFGFRVDELSITMALTVSFVGSIIHFYSIGYMHDEEGHFRYFAYINLFMFFMLTLVLANNILLMFLGWEGVGLASYLLIGFYYKDKKEDVERFKIAPSTAGMKAFIVNRIGDAGFLIGIFLLFSIYHSFDFNVINHKVLSSLESNKAILEWLGILFLIGAVGKSAQIPLYVWLPDAMAGPTPVSALIHAATMVTAGVYMIGRLGVIYLHTEYAIAIISIIGGITAFFAATMGIFQNDIKKVLAYSTVSQLGYMFLAMGVLSFASGIFHLVTHAFFKALLFLGAGSVIVSLHHLQDIRYMGGLKKYLRITYITFLIAVLSISGIPGFSGFFSKDDILHSVYVFHSDIFPSLPKILWSIGVITAGLTAFYMFRLLFLVFFGEYRNLSHHHNQENHLPKETSKWITIPLIILAIFSVISGYIGLPEIFGKNIFKHWLNPVWEKLSIASPPLEHSSHSTEIMLMIISITIAGLGILYAYSLYIKKGNIPPKDSEYKGIAKLIYNKYYVDEIYEMLFVKPTIKLGSIFWKVFDIGIIDWFVNFIPSIIGKLSNKYRKIQTGFVQDYMLLFLSGIVIIIGIAMYVIFGY